MSASVTPIADAQRRYTLAEARQVIFHDFPVDIDAAQVPLSQAIAVLDLVTEILDGKGMNQAEAPKISQCVYAALADVKRAQEAIFGPEPSEVESGFSRGIMPD